MNIDKIIQDTLSTPSFSDFKTKDAKAIAKRFGLSVAQVKYLIMSINKTKTEDSDLANILNHVFRVSVLVNILENHKGGDSMIFKSPICQIALFSRDYLDPNEAQGATLVCTRYCGYPSNEIMVKLHKSGLVQMGTVDHFSHKQTYKMLTDYYANNPFGTNVDMVGFQ